MSTERSTSALLRTRWSAIGAAVAVSLGAGGFGLANAAIDSGDKPVTVTIEAKRILDTRIDVGLSGKFADATPRDLQVTGTVPIAPSGSELVVPADATGVLVNVTVVFPSDPGFLALRPGDAAGAPSTSTVNFFPGSVEPNAATVDLSPTGTVEIWVETSSDSGNAHVLVDVVGYTIDHTHDDRYYTETEADAVHNTKANSTDVYTKTEVDAAVAPKANSADVYTKTEADAAHATKANAADVYTKTEADAAHASASGVDWVAGASAGPLAVGTYTTLATVSVNAPVAGFLVMNAAANITVFTAGVVGNCRLMLDGGAVVSQNITQVGDTPYSNTAAAAVSAGAHTVEIQCRQNNGTAEIGVFAPWLTTVFSPNRL